MAQTSSFNMKGMTSADKILLGATALFFIDTFLPWQRVCASFLTIKACASASAWGGSASFLGVLAALFALALLIWVGMSMAGVSMNVGMPASSVSSILVAGTVLFGLLKFLFSAFNHGGFGAWVGLILLLAIAYGGYMKMQEPKTAPVAPPPAPPAGGPTV
jgi:hypothetical protein